MPSATEHRASSLTKLLLMGDSATGKTTSLLSLVRAGYHVHVCDFDNLLAPLIEACRNLYPEGLDRISFQTFRDRVKMTSDGPVLDGTPSAYTSALKALTTWDDGTHPSEWGPGHVMVIDSFTSMSMAAHNWARGIMGVASVPEGTAKTKADPRQVFYTAQRSFMQFVSMLTGEAFNTNVIAIAHVKMIEVDGKEKGFPIALGSAISPEIPTYFPSIALATKGAGDPPKRTLRLKSTHAIDLKNPRMMFDDTTELPLDTALATVFGKAPQ